MRYTVIWTPTALSELADLWNNASDRQAITAAADRIERRLRRSPETAGKPHGEDRYLVYPPLAARFSINPDDSQVKVTQVWRW